MLLKGKGQKSIFFSTSLIFVIFWTRLWFGLIDADSEGLDRRLLRQFGVLPWLVAEGLVGFATHWPWQVSSNELPLVPSRRILIYGGGCMANSEALHILSISSPISDSNKTRLMFLCDHENSQEKLRKKLEKNTSSPVNDFAKLFLVAGEILSQKSELSRNDEEAIDVTRWSTYEMTHCRTRKISSIADDWPSEN